MNTPLQSLYSDHMSIAAVLDALQHLARRDSAQFGSGKHTDTKVYRAILYYLDIFPERHHHPKEEKCLFKALREATHEADEAMDTLGRQHAAGQAAIRDLEHKLLLVVEGGESEWPVFAAAVEEFVKHYEAHMRLEEDVVMPIARKVLTPEQWREIEREFAEVEDPLAGVGPQPDELLRRITMITPAPLGLGPEIR